MKNLKGEGFGMYTKLYESCVTPILEYLSGIWGSSEFDCFSKIQQRTMLVFIMCWVNCRDGLAYPQVQTSYKCGASFQSVH